MADAMNSAIDPPIIRLRPKANARAIRHGFPWVYANELVVDRRTGKLPAGTIARLQDADRADLGLVALSPGSQIIARMLATGSTMRRSTA